MVMLLAALCMITIPLAAMASNNNKFMPISTQKLKLKSGKKFISLRSSDSNKSIALPSGKARTGYSLANYQRQYRDSYARKSDSKTQGDTPPVETEVTSLPETLPDAHAAKRRTKKSGTVRHSWPLDNKADQRISSLFGHRIHPVTGKKSFHEGLDIAAPKGTNVLASANGTVEAIGTHPRLGKYVKLRHDDDSYSLYGHLSRINAHQGDTLNKRQKLGEVGSTGRSTGNHLDYSLRIGGKAVNPQKHLPALPKRHQELASAK